MGINANIFAEKMWVAFFNKNHCELGIVLTRTVNILTTNKLVKQMMLWTTGLWCTLQLIHALVYIT